LEERGGRKEIRHRRERGRVGGREREGMKEGDTGQKRGGGR